MRILLLITLSGFLGGCTLTKKQADAIRGELWANDGLPADICLDHPGVRSFGVWRRIECKSRSQHEQCKNGEPAYEEFISYCSDRIKTMLTADRERVSEWLKRATRPSR